MEQTIERQSIIKAPNVTDFSEAAAALCHYHLNVNTKIMEIQEHCKLLERKCEELKQMKSLLSSENFEKLRSKDEYTRRNKINATIGESLFQTKNDFDKSKCEVKAELIMTVANAKKKAMKYRVKIADFKHCWENSESKYNQFPAVTEIKSLQKRNEELKEEGIKMEELLENSYRDFDAQYKMCQKSVTKEIIELSEEMIKYKKYASLEAKRKEKETILQQLLCEQRSLESIQKTKENPYVNFCKANIPMFDRLKREDHETPDYFVVDITAFDNIIIPEENLETNQDEIFSIPKNDENYNNELDPNFQSDVVSEYSSEECQSSLSVTETQQSEMQPQCQMDVQNIGKQSQGLPNKSANENQDQMPKDITPKSSQYWCQVENGETLRVKIHENSIQENDGMVLNLPQKRSSDEIPNGSPAKLVNTGIEDEGSRAEYEIHNEDTYGDGSNRIEDGELACYDYDATSDSFFPASPMVVENEFKDDGKKPEIQEENVRSSALGVSPVSSPPVFPQSQTRNVLHNENDQGKETHGAFTFSFGNATANSNPKLSIFNLF